MKRKSPQMYSIFGFLAGSSSLPQSASRVAVSIIIIRQFKHHRVNIHFSKAKMKCPRNLRSASKANMSQMKITSVG